MITLFADESYDDHTYVLGGWLATPTHCRILESEWRKMLGTLMMPNGSPCQTFHASAIMNQRDEFTGWGKDDAFSAFDKATAVLAERPGRFALWPCAVASEIPVGLRGADRDAVWLTLFMRFFLLVLDVMPGARSIEFVFDKKPEIEEYARAAYDKVTGAMREQHPDIFLKGMDFVKDHDASMLQAADLLIFEWRKSLTNRLIAPERDNRPWFPKIRAARPRGALARYDIAKYLREFNAITDPGERARRLLSGDEVGRD